MEKAACSTQFWLRKLHGLTGFVFLGYFLCLHVRGAGAYDSTFLRWAFLYIPLAFHGLYGLYICYEASPNNVRYGQYVRNWMYMFQRATGILLVPFIVLHYGDQELGWNLGAWFPYLWYAGLIAAVFHLANGLFGTMIDWGITVGPHSQRVFVVLSFIGFLVLSGYGLYELGTGGYF